MNRTKAVTVKTLLDIARGLKSEHSENPEYDRALCELICEAAGLSMEHVSAIASELGITL